VKKDGIPEKKARRGPDQGMGTQAELKTLGKGGRSVRGGESLRYPRRKVILPVSKGKRRRGKNFVGSEAATDRTRRGKERGKPNRFLEKREEVSFL